MLSPQFVNGKDLRDEIGHLNGAGVLPEKLKTVGVKKEVMVKSFIEAINSIPQGEGEGDDYKPSEEEQKIPDSVINFYNSIVEGEDPSPEEIAKLEEKKKTKARPSGPSNEQLAYDMVTAGKSEAEIAKAFTDRYHERGQKDEAFITKRIAIYTKIAKRRIEGEKGEPAKASEPAKKAEETAEE